MLLMAIDIFLMKLGKILKIIGDDSPSLRNGNIELHGIRFRIHFDFMGTDDIISIAAQCPRNPPTQVFIQYSLALRMGHSGDNRLPMFIRRFFEKSIHLIFMVVIIR